MAFEFTPGPLVGLVVVQPRVFTDSRGFFFESFKASEFEAAGIPGRFVQSNHSLSRRGVLRGIHFQAGAHAQGKLVRVVEGAVWDLAVDLRTGSATFGRWFGIELNTDNRSMLYLPPGFGHATLALSALVEVVYQCTSEYHRASEMGVRWDDPTLAIEWPTLGCDYSLSERDRGLPRLFETGL